MKKGGWGSPAEGKGDARLIPPMDDWLQKTEKWALVAAQTFDAQRSYISTYTLRSKHPSTLLASEQQDGEKSGSDRSSCVGCRLNACLKTLSHVAELEVVGR